MKWTLVLVAAALLAPPAEAGSTRPYAVAAFDRIHVSEGIELNARVGGAQSVVAETDEDDLDGLVVEVQDRVLILRRADTRRVFLFFFSSHRDEHYKVSVTLPVLHGLRASASAAATVTGPVSGDAGIAASSSARADVAEVRGGMVSVDAASSGRVGIRMLGADALTMSAASSGKIEVDDMGSSSVAIRVSSSGSVKAGGGCSRLDASASSSGHIRASALKCETVTASASSSGDMQLSASKRVKANASSSGHIAVAGGPQQVDEHESSGGSVLIAQ